MFALRRLTLAAARQTVGLGRMSLPSACPPVKTTSLLPRGGSATFPSHSQAMSTIALDGAPQSLAWLGTSSWSLPGWLHDGIYWISTLKRRRKMMNKHKLRKRRKKNRMKSKK